MKIRAAILEEMGRQPPYAASQPLTIDEVELAPPGRGEVLVKIAAAGLCHSDLSVIDGNRPRPMPMALGHEAAALVVETGDDVDDLAKGDHVVLVFVPSCGHCEPCATGRPALCEPAAAANAAGTLLSGARRITRRGMPVHHHLGVSAFAEYATVSRRSLVKIDHNVPLEHAALFGCAVLTGVGAVVNTARVTAGSTVAVVGLGGVGLAALLGAFTQVEIDQALIGNPRLLGHALEVLDDVDPEPHRDALLQLPDVRVRPGLGKVVMASHDFNPSYSSASCLSAFRAEISRITWSSIHCMYCLAGVNTVCCRQRPGGA